MVKYTVKRFLQSIITIFIVVSIVFLLLRLMRIDGYFPAGSWERLSWNTKLPILQHLGLYDKAGDPINPLIQLYNYYVRIFTEGSLGVSTQLYVGREIWPIIAEKIPITMQVNLIAIALAFVAGYVLGIAMARYKNSLIDHGGMVYIVFVRSVPILVTYLVVQFYVTKWLGVSMIYRRGDVLTLVTPILCSMLGPIAGDALWMRRYMVDEMNRDYVKLAYAKGLPTRTVMYRHVLRNAFVPMAYGLPASIVFTMSGSLILERLFNIPGTGNLLVSAIDNRDNNFVQALVFMFSAMGIFSVFLGDMLAIIVDPRITLISKGGTRR